MASSEQVKKDAGIGSGPEYSYPTSGGAEEPVPVASGLMSSEEEAKGSKPVPGEQAGELSEKEIREEERLEAAQAGEWSEDMAQNAPAPGETTTDPDLTDRVPLDTQP